jgi:hypothetical protein
MAKIKISAMACVTVLALVLSSCPNAVNWAGSDVARQYFVDVNPKPENGEIILSADFEAQGKGIQVYILPAPGFVYKAGSLGFRNRSSGNQNLRTISQVQGSYYYQFSLPGAHTEVTAQFVSNIADNMASGADPAKNTVSIDSGVTNGFIIPNVTLAEPGSTVTLNVFPAEGYVVDTGSFEVFEVINGQLSPAVITVAPVMPHTFPMPSGRDVLIKAEFVPADFKEIAETAGNYLKNGKYDIAARLYEAAYKKRAEAGTELALLDEVIFYHAIGRLGNILIEGRVRTLLGSGKNNLNLGSVPSTLDDWMCDIASGWYGTDENYWYEFYRGVDYTQDNTFNENRKGYDVENPPLWHPSTEQTGDVILPKISYYSGFDRMDTSGQGSGFPGDFGNSSLINQTEKGRQKYWHVYFMLMLCQTRDEGLNLLLEKMDDLVFGSAFEEAASIAATLRPEAKVPLYNNLKARFRNNKGYGNTGDGLERYYGPGSAYVGKAELDFIFGMGRLAKATVQYLRGYNWFILGQPWLIDETKPENGPDQILNYAFSLAETNDVYSTLWNSSQKTDVLPLRGKFLEIRNAGFINKSKEELKNALNLINNSVTYWFGTNFNNASASKPSGSNFSPEGYQNYRWAAGGFTAALNALQNDSVFYFPRKLPVPSASARWPAANQADYGVNLGTVFTPGVFSLKNLVVTDPGNRRVPALYRIPWYYQNMTDRTGFYILPRQAARVTGPIPDDDSGTVANQQVDFMLYTFEMNMDSFRAIFPKGFEQRKYTNHYNQAPTEQRPNPDYNPDLEGRRAFLYEVFPAIPIWPERPTYLSGPGNGGNKSAQYLYKYYHDIK